MDNLLLDGTKIDWYADRVKAWEKGKRIAPVTVDIALTRACNYNCVYCYGKLQENKRAKISAENIIDFLDDAKDIGVKGISLVSDGESTLHPYFEGSVVYGKRIGLAMAVGTNGYALTESTIKTIVPRLSYLRFNISAGEEQRYNEIMRGPKDGYKRVLQNINSALYYRNSLGAKCTIGLQMVLMPEFADQILPLTELAIKLKVDYLMIKHCSDDEHGQLGVRYEDYEKLYPLLREAEGRSNNSTKIYVKWSKIKEGNKRSYKRCYGAPFIIQISGSGLVAPCGMLFNDSYKDFHLGNIAKQRFKDIWSSVRYWSVMERLASKEFDATTMCGCLCLQHNVCRRLDEYKKKRISITIPKGRKPKHIEFI